MITAAFYGRKSTEQTGVADEARSVARQEARAREFAVERGWEISPEFTFSDDGISGAEFETRPGLQALLRELTPRPRFAHLIIMDTSRLGREAWETNYLVKRLLQAGVRIWTYLDGREITVQDKLRHTVTGLVDDEERDRGRRRTRDAMLHKARLGHVTGGVTFGYRNVEVRTPAGKRSHVERAVDPVEAAVVERIFGLYLEGCGFRTIAKRLNAEHAPAPTPRRENRPRGWSPTTVRDVLQRPDYVGELRWGRVRKRDAWGVRHPQRQPQDDWVVLPAPHLAIVPREHWDAVHARLHAQRAIYLRGTGGRLQSKPANGMASKYLMTGLATCGVCGGSFGPRLAAGRSRRQVYRCLVNHTRGSAVCANTLQVPVLAADTAVLTLVEATVLRPDVAAAAVEEALRRLRPKSTDAEHARLQTALRQIEGQLANLTIALAAGGGDTATLVQAVKDRERESARLSRAPSPTSPPSKGSPPSTSQPSSAASRRNSPTGEASLAATPSKPDRSSPRSSPDAWYSRHGWIRPPAQQPTRSGARDDWTPYFPA
jgi:site-specific DNA recombinase